MADTKPTIADQAAEAGDKARKAWEENKKDTIRKQMIKGDI